MVAPFRTELSKEKERREGYDKEDDEVEVQQKVEQKQKPEMEDSGVEEKTEEAAVDIDEGLPIVLSDDNTEKPGFVFVLENASLEVVKVGQAYQLLNSYDHSDFLSDNNRDPGSYRPELIHQTLLTILDSTLNKSGRLKMIYVSTQDNHLVEVTPKARIPRTYKRFAGLMVQLLLKLSITAVGGEKPLRVIKNPVQDHLPANSKKIGLSYCSENLVNMQQLATVCKDTNTVFVLDPGEYGRLTCNYIDDFVSISRYSLSAAHCVSRICDALSDTEQDNEEKEITEEGASVNFFDQTAVDVDGRLPKVPCDKPGVVFVLENSSLEVAKVGKTFQLLNSEDHATFLRKNNRNPADYRPDITHQALLLILGSPVNKAGRLKTIFVRTQRGVLLEVKTHVRLPTIYKKFSEVMVRLLGSQNFSEYGTVKIRVIKNPMTDYLPANCRKIGLSCNSDNLVKPHEFLASVSNKDTVFVVGAMAHNKLECEYIDELVSISEYPLSTATCISRLCETYSRLLNII